jgi:Neuraminidase (sialidase)
MSSSQDGGETWSPPAQVNQDPTHDAFTPSLAAADGTIALTYYDTRADDPSDRSTFLATAWLARSSDGGATWSEEPLGPAFDLKHAKFGDVYFLGDYQGLAAAVTGAFVPFFAIAGTGASDPSDIVVLPTAP